MQQLYIAKLIFNIVFDEDAHKAKIENQWKMISAQNEIEAKLKAEEIGKANEEIVTNVHNTKIHWQYVRTAYIESLPENLDGHTVATFTIE